MEERFNNLEKEVGQHKNRIYNLEEKTSDMSKTLEHIQRTLEQIKYIAVGMVGYFVLQEFGFFAAFKAASKAVG